MSYNLLFSSEAEMNLEESMIGMKNNKLDWAWSFLCDLKKHSNFLQNTLRCMQKFIMKFEVS